MNFEQIKGFKLLGEDKKIGKIKIKVKQQWRHYKNLIR